MKTTTLLVAIIVLCGMTMSLSADAQEHQGVVVPTRSASLRAEVGGQLLPGELAYEGAALEEGGLIARLEDRGQAEALALAELRAKSELAIRKAEETINELRLRLEQAEDMAEREAGSEWEVRQARVELELATIDAAIAREEREAAALQEQVEAARLAQYAVRAPFDGRVMKLEAHGGATIAPGDPLAVFASLAELKTELYLPVERFGQMKVGLTYGLRAGPPVDGRLDARLEWVDPMIDPASQTFRCVLTINNADLSLPSGFIVWLPEGSQSVQAAAAEVSTDAGGQENDEAAERTVEGAAPRE